MAARFDVDEASGKECANCGATQDLLKCSRCHQVWFCSVRCQKAYWPFHKSECRKNDFADAIEKVEPKFSKWMRKHGKLAVLKDDEVDRLERASQATSGRNRQEVMESMYGRADPKPLAPSYSPEDLKRMREKEEERALEARKVLSITDKIWSGIDVPKELGVDCGKYKWFQTQAYVELFVRLPPFASSRRMKVTLKPKHLRIEVDQNVILEGDLYKEIKQDESTWYIYDGILEIYLLKRFRRGLTYAKGETNADTYWHSIFTEGEYRLAHRYPPVSYYSTEWSGVADEYKSGRRKDYKRKPIEA